MPKKTDENKLEKAMLELKIKDFNKEEFRDRIRLVQFLKDGQFVTFISEAEYSRIGVSKKGIELSIGTSPLIEEKKIEMSEDLISRETATLNFVLGTFLANIDTKKYPLKIQMNATFELPKKEDLIHSRINQEFIREINRRGIESNIIGLRIAQQIDGIEHTLAITERKKVVRITSQLSDSTETPAINLKEIIELCINNINLVLGALEEE